MLQGAKVDLRVIDRPDVEFLYRWRNDDQFYGEYEPAAQQISRADLERELFDRREGAIERVTFIIQKKDGTPVGEINYRGGTVDSPMEIGFVVVPGERRKGYATEAAGLLVDYLFLARPIERIQSTALTGNAASQRVLEKTGFRREGVMRKATFVRGRWVDEGLYSLLREEWGQSHPSAASGPP